jgi:hypothetical protein
VTKLHINKLTPAWKIILNQIGLPYTETDSVEAELVLMNTYSAGMENLQQPGIILTPKVASQFLKYKIYPQKSIFLQGEFADLNPLDLHTNFYLFKEAKLLKSGIQRYKNFWILPFAIEDVIIKNKNQRKKFYAERYELPSEIVSKVSKGNIRRWLQRVFLKILQENHKIYVRYSHLPQPEQNLFIFRIDTDFANLNEVEQLYELLEKYEIKASWYIEATAEAKLMKFYRKLQENNHEVGLHCFRHRVFKDYDRNLQNMLQGKTILQKNGIFPRGFVAPFGEWNENLDLAIQELGFDYSSEFSLNYDDLPFYPYTGNKFSANLQIPIHPISIGRLRRSHFTEQEMIEYFRFVLKQKGAYQEPLIIYHHPGHKHWQVLEAIFQEVQAWPKQTMLEYANWWRQRQEAEILNETTEIPFYMQKEDKYTYTKDLKVTTSKLNWQLVKSGKPVMNPNLRKWSWRDWLYNFEAWRGKVKK